MTAERVVIRHEGSEWAIFQDGDNVRIMVSAGPFGIPARIIDIPPAIHLSVCNGLRAVSRHIAKGKKS